MAVTAKGVDLSVDLGFLKLRNPVLTASGTFGYGLEFEPYLELAKLGGFVVKGLYYKPREGNPPPRLVETASGLINAIGLQGVGVEAFAAKVLPKLRRFDTAVIVNVCGADDDEYAAVVEFLDRQEGIAAYELNISCPNVKKEGACPALSPRTTFDLVKKIKASSRRPSSPSFRPTSPASSRSPRRPRRPGRTRSRSSTPSWPWLSTSRRAGPSSGTCTAA